jgi:GH35 family endo-1,4-beta-xylanase
MIRHGEPPYYAYFEHPDGSWYMVWMTETYPKTERGHRFHVHSNYDKLGVVRPNLEIKWYEQSYGMKNWDFDTFEDAVAHFYHERFLPRMEHGYRLVMGNIPPEWLSGSDERRAE